MKINEGSAHTELRRFHVIVIDCTGTAPIEAKYVEIKLLQTGRYTAFDMHHNINILVSPSNLIEQMMWIILCYYRKKLNFKFITFSFTILC